MGAMGVAHAGGAAPEELGPEVQAAVNDLLEDSLLAARALVATSQPLVEAIAIELVEEETLNGSRLNELRRRLRVRRCTSGQAPASSSR